ncbi:SulP family inorganic anion transporter [Sphingomonas sp. RG327]|jgi:SulP family sulfate permease|uniref:SulP family inorganic anion transporter n=1 Tax=Sphingomonas anseongensis TaxID=2908207 RepID=A0ABT0REI1_9SPHN|nr:SulP family inorganic anion transporter [Sphingomonas anseongensis]MCL6678671.1 SulP family inorganic anion transporter [Sphingomonas anseongensis]
MALPEAFTPKLLTVFREGYRAPDFRADAIAGLTVAIVALPLAMALGIASGASPREGLVTAIVAGFLISALGGSRVQIGGPTGAFVVIVAGVIAAHGFSGLILATIMAGIILIAAGYAGVGKLMRYVPMPVVTGFTAGIAVIIASSQLGDFLGLRTGPVPADFIDKWAAYAGALGTANWMALAVGAASLAVIIILKGVAPRAPGYLIAILAATAASALLKLPVETVGDRFHSMATGVPLPRLPEFSIPLLREVVPSAFVIAFLAGIEALLSATVADGMTGRRHRSGQELVGMGIANIASGFFGGLPATGAIARTATNIRAGGRTPMAGIFHALFLLIFTVVAGRLLALVPMTALAAVLLMVAWGMSEFDRFVALVKTDAGERGLLILTFLLTVFVDLTVAIGVGVTLAALLFMMRMSETAGLVAVDSAEEPELRDQLPQGVEVFRFTGPIFFGVAGEMLEALRRAGQRPRAIVLRMEQVPYIDATGANALATFTRQAKSAGTEVWLAGMRDQPREFLAKLEPRFAGARRASSWSAALKRLST